MADLPAKSGPDVSKATVPPSPDSVRSALGRILQSSEFQSSPQLCAFLSYAVEASLRGEEHLLKGHNIGVSVLGRAVDFDSQRDPIVRVEANRLRRTLAGYYSGSGTDETLRIVMERGSYVPRFEWAGSDDAAGEEETLAPASADSRWQVARPLIALGLVVVVAFALLLLFGGPPAVGPRDDVPATADLGLDEPALPTIRIERFARPPVGPVSDRADILASNLTVALARFPELRVLADGVRAPDFELAGEVAVAGDKTAASFSLTAVATSDVVWTRTIDLPTADFVDGNGPDQLVTAVTIAIAPQFGAIAQYLDGHNALAGNRNADSYRCLVQAQLFVGPIDDGRWQRLHQCLGKMLETFPKFADGLAAQALLLLANFRLNPEPELARSLFEEAELAGRRALELAPANVRALWAEQSIAFHKGDLDAAIVIGTRAIASNPLDPMLRAQAALVWIAAGNPEAARREIEIGRKLDLVHAGIFPALDLFTTFDDVGKPRSIPLPSGEPHITYEAMALCVGFNLARKPVERDLARRELYAMMPLFQTDTLAALHRQFPETPFTGRFAVALAAAGVGR